MRQHLCMLALAFVGVSEARGAEPSTGTLIPGRTTSSPVHPDQAARASEEALLSKSPSLGSDLKIARIVMDCVVDKRPVVAINFLNAFMENRQDRMRRSYEAALSKCLYETQNALGSEKMLLRVSGFTNYSLLAEAYLRRHGVPDLEIVPVKDLIESKYYRESSPDYQLSACLAYTQPSATKNLVVSGVGSEEEKKAFSALAPLISACVPAGATLALGKTWLRLRLATSLYLRAPPKSPRSSKYPARDDS